MPVMVPVYPLAQAQSLAALEPVGLLLCCGQSLHASEDGAAALNVPAAHGSTLVPEPVYPAFARHWSSEELPFAVVVACSGHTSQLSASVCAWKWPTGHCLHWSVVVSLLNVPLAQLKHSDPDSSLPFAQLDGTQEPEAESVPVMVPAYPLPHVQSDPLSLLDADPLVAECAGQALHDVSVLVPAL